jgi:predicted AlkP superfamily phosphohydrolase/phosphomutase
MAEFRELVDPKSGHKLLARVARGSEIYTYAAKGVLLPDIVLVPVDGYVVGAGLAEPFLREDGERGNHRHNGIVLIEGPGVRQSVANFRPNLIDIAPTILHLLGLPVPADMDGRVLEEVFSKSRSVQFENVDNSRLLEAQEHSDVEAEVIEQRLRGLGYVE